MAITKTKFMNLVRCPKYASLLKEEEQTSKMSYEEYEKEEWQEQQLELEELSEMDVLLPYYNEVELQAGRIAKHYFDGSFRYAKDTKNQKKFECWVSNTLYLCYVDIYNEGSMDRVIEVKATTSKDYLDLSIFKKKDGIYYLLEDLGEPLPEYYEKAKEKLIGRFQKLGRYIYDLSFQRWVIEKEDQNEKHYYLSVLNHQYVYDGKRKEEKPIYEKDQNKEELMVYFDFTSLTKELQKNIEEDILRIQDYFLKKHRSPIGPYCEKGKRTECPYASICFEKIPEKNSVFSYLDSQHGFSLGTKKFSVYELIQMGMIYMTDVPNSALTRWKNRMQKEVVTTHIPYVDQEKIEKGLKELTYPIYHLDFETFPCPLPRLKGESPYTQSVFQFSLHIERKPGVCDKLKDHYGFLAPDLKDHREELIQALIKWIPIDQGGTIVVYNDTFEKGRLRELAELFPKYEKELLSMVDHIFDLMDLIKGNSKFYERLGYCEEDAKKIVFYHENMNGSFSIKKVLPIFSNLSYDKMEVANGSEASATYASFESFDEATYKRKYQKLEEYCMQDTWAMVEILNGLRKLEKEGSL